MVLLKGFWLFSFFFTFLARAFLARAFLACTFLARAFLACTFLACAFLARAFLARAFLACAFLACTFLARAFLARAFLASTFLACTFLIPTFLACANPDKGLVFETKSIKIGNHKLLVAIADNKEKRQKGLMNRSSWGEWQGMLFIFDKEAPRVFWMKNTQLPVSIGFFDKNRILLEVYDLEPPKSVFQKNVDRVFSKKAAQYALEVPKGWYKKQGVTMGKQLVIPQLIPQPIPQQLAIPQ